MASIMLGLHWRHDPHDLHDLEKSWNSTILSFYHAFVRFHTLPISFVTTCDVLLRIQHDCGQDLPRISARFVKLFHDLHDGLSRSLTFSYALLRHVTFVTFC